jgi:hypothetical protein
MFTKVDNVLAGNALKVSGNVEDVKKGEYVILDASGKIIAPADTTNATGIYFAVASADGVLERSNLIQKGSHPRFVAADHEDPEEQTATIDFTNATIVIGHRYVMRIVYKDMYEHPGQFTHTYEVTATTEAAADLANAFAKRVNKHPNRRVNAAVEAGKLTLTAMPKDDNEGVYSINEYSVVSMAVTVYYTIPGALLSNVPENVPGATVKYNTKTATPGVGYWKQVRDLERRALGYKGHVFTDAYPVVEPKRLVEEGAKYNYVMVEFDNHYLSPDNQYIKDTPLRIQIFTTDKTDNFKTALTSFGAKELDNIAA